jgi:hypothetical protein
VSWGVGLACGHITFVMIKTGADLRFPTAPSAPNPFFCQTLCSAGKKTASNQFDKQEKIQETKKMWP